MHSVVEVAQQIVKERSSLNKTIYLILLHDHHRTPCILIIEHKFDPAWLWGKEYAEHILNKTKK